MQSNALRRYLEKVYFKNQNSEVTMLMKQHLQKRQDKAVQKPIFSFYPPPCSSNKRISRYLSQVQYLWSLALVNYYAECK